RWQSTGALYAGYRERIEGFAVCSCEVRYVGCQYYLLSRNRRGELTPNGRLPSTHKFDLGCVQPPQNREDILHAIGIVALIEGEEHFGVTVARRHGSSGLKRVDGIDGPPGAH